jgi:hypothetical protein
MKKSMLLMLFLGLMVTSIFAQTNHSGTISSNETWFVAGNPHIITGNITVSAGVTLTIEPGAEVYFNSGRRMVVRGVLNADGTAADPILFTSNEASPAKGDWQYIYFNGSDPGSIMDYCEVSYGGGNGAMIRVRNSTDNVTISNSSISNSAGYGIQLNNAAANPAISDCSITDCDNYPIYTYADKVKDITGTMIFTGNTPNAIFVDDENVNTGTWLNHGIPYVIGGSFTVNDGETFTIDAGNTLKFNGNYFLRILGSMNAIGTASERIIFTSNQAVPAKGDWNRIFFNISETSVMEYCDIDYAGSGTSSIDIRNSGNNVTISNCSITNGGGYGIYNRSGSLTNIADVTVEQCDNYPIYVLTDGVYNMSGLLSLNGNAPQDAVWVEGGTLSVSGTWLDLGYPYVLGNADLAVPDGVNLTLSAGIEMKIDGNRQIRVFGTFNAAGTFGNKIKITSNEATPAPGDWENIYLFNVDGFCFLEYLILEYAGSNNGAVYTRGNNFQYISLRYLQISNSDSYGIYNTGGSTPEIYGSTIQSCADYPIRTGANSVARIGAISNNMSGNNPDAIRVDPETITNIFNGVWNTNNDIPYVIMGDFTLADGVPMTFNPGVTLKFMPGARFQIDGKLVADGTMADPITFTSNQATPAPGDWERLYFNNADAGTMLDYCIISYGGTNNGNLDIRGATAPLSITNSTISFSASNGVYLANNASCSFINNEITDNNDEGIFMNGAITATFGTNDTEWNRIYGNSGFQLRNGTLDTDAKYVYWGSDNCSDVGDFIFDKVDQNSLGLVDYTPWLDGSLGMPALSTVWNGSVNMQWNEDGNWDNYSPCGMIDVTIPKAPANQPVVSTTESCENLTLEAGAKLTVNSGQSLTVNGDFLMEADADGTASLLENGGLTVVGKTDVEYYLSADRWHYVSAPLDNQTANVFFDIYLRYHDEATNTFTYIVDETTPLNVGQGYTAWSSSTYPAYDPPGDISVTYTGGSLNSGNYSLPVSLTGSGWNLVGNPYPSAVDWDNLGWTKTNLDGTVYVWDGTQYLTWNGSTGDLTDGVIPAMQGFLVYANGLNPALSVSNGVRVHGPDPYKKGSIENILKLSVFGNGYSDNTFVHFNENATAGFDNQFDGYKLMGLDEAPQLYSFIEDKLIRMNVMKEIGSELVVPLGLVVGAETEYTIQAFDVETFDASLQIYLEDKFEGNMIDLKSQQDYTFTASPIDDPNRFALHFSQTVNSDIPVVAEADALTIYSYDNAVYIRNNSNTYEGGEVTIFNISGQQMGRADLYQTNLNKIEMDVEAGYYVVQVITGQQVYSQKVFIR